MMLSDRDGAIRQAGLLLKKAHHTVVFSGAGISTPSGIPDFRSANTGLWTRNDPMEVASLTAFRHRPQVFFNWLHPLATQIWSAQPNPAHRALASLEQAGRVQAVITQNIDGLHQRAGSQTVIEVHGSLNTFSCPQCKQTYPLSQYQSSFLEKRQMPRCPKCTSLIKPDIVLFEEMLPEKAWASAESHSMKADLMIVAGSSLEVSPANQLPVFALQNHAHLVIINLTETALDEAADILLPYNVAEVLPLIVQEIL